jgi:hypothetical protein
MLSVGPDAPGFPSSQNIRVILPLRPDGNVHYRHHPLSWPRIRVRRRAPEWPAQQDRWPAVENEPVIRRGRR